MPETSGKQFEKYSINSKSVAVKISRAVFNGCFILGLILLLISVNTYVYELVRNQVNTAFNLSESAKAIVSKSADVENLAIQVINIYRGMSDEEREKCGTDEYYAKFADIANDSDWRQANMVLSDFRNTKAADYIYIAIFDRNTQSLVYILDTDLNEKTLCPVGHREVLGKRELRRFLDWDGTGIISDFGPTEEYGYMFTSGVPVSGDLGDCRAFVLADIRADSIFRRALFFVLIFTSALIVIMLALSMFITRRMNQVVVAPLNKIGDATKDYVRDKRASVEGKQHFSSLDINTGDEIEELCRAMGSMEFDLDEYEKYLARVTADRERVETELKLASRIQGDMLPSIFTPPFPDRTDFDIYALMNPAKEVGGDFYDFFLIDKERLGIVVADVSGKGIPAALFMMVTKSMIKTAVMGGAGAAEALTNVNSQICRSEHEGMFVTVWAGILDLKSGVLTAANAGHEYPIIKDADGEFQVYKDKHGFVVGGIDGLKFKDYQVELKPGSKLFLYTDGVTEASGESKELFGMDRLVASLRKAEDSEPEEIIKAVRKDIDDFVLEAEQFDDITMVCLEYFGEREDAEAGVMDSRRNRIILDITDKAEIAKVTEITDLIDSELDKLGCTSKAKMQINIAIDELYSNIAKYAYEKEGAGKARVVMSYCEVRNEVTIVFGDSGEPFDPTTREDPDVTLPADKRSIGGLGIFLVKKSMDEFSYEYSNGMNLKTIKKIIK